MSTKEHQEFFPENVEFLGFVGGWDCFIGVDTVEMLCYLIRTKDLDWLEAVVKYSGTILSRKLRHERGGVCWHQRSKCRVHSDIKGSEGNKFARKRTIELFHRIFGLGETICLSLHSTSRKCFGMSAWL